VRQIYPVVPAPATASGPPPADDSRETTDLLGRLYAYPRDSGQPRPWVRANMISSVDGAAESGGRSGGLGGPADRSLFGVLRSLADVILVGAGTARAEGYGPARAAALRPALRQGRPETPPVAVISGSLDLDPDAPLLTEAAADARTIIFTTSAAPASRQAAVARHAQLIVAEPGQLTASYAITELGKLGHCAVLAEGGPSLLAQMAGEGVLDELCVTFSPLLVGGDARRIMSGGTAADLTTAALRPLRLAHILAEDDFLFCRYLLTEGNA
jgi:riboflavin biosynthesis pyrimidine reductase